MVHCEHCRRLLQVSPQLSCRLNLCNSVSLVIFDGNLKGRNMFAKRGGCSHLLSLRPGQIVDLIGQVFLRQFEGMNLIFIFLRSEIGQQFFLESRWDDEWTSPSGCDLVDCSLRRATMTRCMAVLVLDFLCNNAIPSASERAETTSIALCKASTDYTSWKLTWNTDLSSPRCFTEASKCSSALVNFACDGQPKQVWHTHGVSSHC